MVRYTMIAAAAAALLVAGCAEIQAPSGPPIVGTATGPGSPQLRQLVDGQPHSANASAGVATIDGASGDGRPSIVRTEPGSGSVGNAPATIGGFPVVGSPNKGGS